MRYLLTALAVLLAPTISWAEDMTPKALVTTAFTELFIEQDVTAIDRYWSEDYIQRSPLFPGGLDALREAFAEFPEGYAYEVGMVIADDDLVAVHARFTGYTPKPMIVVDIVRVADGKIVEHWDVMQEEVTDTPHGNAMFTPIVSQ